MHYFCCFLGQLNDSRIEKADPLKGDTIKTDINNDAEGTLFIFFFNLLLTLFHDFTYCQSCFRYVILCARKKHIFDTLTIRVSLLNKLCIGFSYKCNDLSQRAKE